jgi:hypothetical protein
METMSHREKVERHVADMRSRGLWRSTAAPPLYRVLWAIGVPVRPPLMQTFWTLAAFMGIYFGVAWGVFMRLLFWQQMPWQYWASVSGLAGLLFGLSMATYYRVRARSLGLPSWEDYLATSASR